MRIGCSPHQARPSRARVCVVWSGSILFFTLGYCRPHEGCRGGGSLLPLSSNISLRRARFGTATGIWLFWLSLSLWSVSLRQLGGHAPSHPPSTQKSHPMRHWHIIYYSYVLCMMIALYLYLSTSVLCMMGGHDTHTHTHTHTHNLCACLFLLQRDASALDGKQWAKRRAPRI
ncbi:hypothetical protein LX32DRAFT_252662 [Colletotrichum zoysiae]|uniref:Uncharacterized protein n=1 Tax=Colletotrichum zoysiae TaxID=1216348 RepID=A0AAD9HVG3_9PEZI|nr:hypothetical protein LX32DRAFT_252662 [Colletotrichum zoysiae]